ncbi:MAG TPA: post-COAP-1 domain-containing protein [Anaerolineales bacterium]|nr:post-COAP-1 domain-containing protein [Anaerolineales bacterium]
MKPMQLIISILVTVLTVGVTGVSTSALVARSNSGNVGELIQMVSDWEQVNTNGFGDPQTGEVTAVEAFNGFLYAGTYNPIDPAPLYDGAQIFRSTDGATWTAVTLPGFGNAHDIAPPAIQDFVVFNNQLYAGTGRGNASQLWRSLNGTIWAPMDVTGFSDPDNVDVGSLAVYNGMIYAGVTNQVTGAQIWRSFTGDNNTWTQVAPATPGTVPANITGFAEFGGALYAAVEAEEGPAQIWQSFGGSSGSWTTVVSDGFGDVNTLYTGGIAVFGGNLYVGAGNTADGAQLWRTNDGATWELAIPSAFGDPNNQLVEMVYVFQNELYASVKNAVTGVEIWRTADGTLWEQANLDGFGDSNNTGTNRSNATVEFMGQLYVGTSNIMDGGELWRTVQQLPETPTSTPTNTLTPTSTNTLTFIPISTATNTPSNTPTYTSTSTATSTLTYTSTAYNTPTNTVTSTLTFTSTTSNTPTKTATSTPADTATSTLTFTPTASNTPTNTPTPLPNTPGKVTGGGNIDLTDGKLTFGFVVQHDEGDENPSGNLTFKDHSAKLSMKATSFTLLSINGNHARITGYATVNGVTNISFTVDIYQQDEPGKEDILMIQIPDTNDYSTGGTISGGNIKIKPMK